MDIITGYLGEPHVTAEQDRDVNIGVVGDGSYVMPTGQRLAAEVQTNNEVRIRDGVLIHQGCAASIKKNTYDTVTITNGSQGMKRIDLIVARYQRNVETGVESLGLVALQGTPVESDPAVPVHTEGDIQAGDAVADMPLYEVEKDGLNITRVTKVFEEVEYLSSLNGKMELSEYNVDNLNIYEENGIVHVNGMVAINAATGNIQLPYANAGIRDVHAPVIGVFQDMSIAGYGYLNLGRNTNAAYIGMNTAVTYAIMSFSYKGQ